MPFCGKSQDAQTGRRKDSQRISFLDESGELFTEFKILSILFLGTNG